MGHSEASRTDIDLHRTFPEPVWYGTWIPGNGEFFLYNVEAGIGFTHLEAWKIHRWVDGVNVLHVWGPIIGYRCW